jgi:hypothetical protein
MRWLAQEFGLPRLRGATVVLPTDEFFPGRYDATKKAGRALVARVCDYMGINPAGVQVRFYTERQPLVIEGAGMQHWDGAAGLYQDSPWGEQVIKIEASALQDPTVLVATAAHELGHVLLLGQGRISHEVEDQEELTDLLTVFLGLGVFTANSRVRSSASHDGLTESFSIRRLGYLSQPITGYALALFAFARGETDPAWAGHLCADVRSPFRTGLRYLQKTGDCLFDAREGAFKMLSDDRLPPGFGGEEG